MQNREMGENKEMRMKLEKQPQKRKALLIYNPKSGNGMFPMNLDLIIKRFQEQDMIVTPVRSDSEGIIEKAISTMDVARYRQIIVAGGDGTINRVVNTMMKYDIDLPIAIFPSGTANDFAYYLDLPHDIDGMIDIALGDNITCADLAVVNQKYFVNVAAMGTIVDVSQKTDPALKNTIGVLAYYLKGLSEVSNLRPIPINIKSAEFEGKVDMYFMVVMNGCSAGGFKKVAPESDATDGLLDVVIFKKMPIIELGPLLLSVIVGEHPKNKNVIAFKTSELQLDAIDYVSTDIDGEKGEKLPLHFSVIPNKLKIFTA